MCLFVYTHPWLGQLPCGTGIAVWNKCLFIYSQSQLHYLEGELCWKQWYGVCKGGVGGGVDVELNFGPFSTCLSKAITNERCSICNVFSHWLKPCTMLFQTMKTSHDFILISVGPDRHVVLLWLQDCIEFDYRPKMNSHVLKSYVSKFAVKFIKLNWVIFEKGRCDWHAEYTTAWCQIVL